MRARPCSTILLIFWSCDSIVYTKVWILRLYLSSSILVRMLLCAHVSRMWQKIPPKPDMAQVRKRGCVSSSLTNFIVLFHKMVRFLRKLSCLFLEEPLCQSLTPPELGLRQWEALSLKSLGGNETLQHYFLSVSEPGLTLFWTGYVVSHSSYTHTF